MSQEDVAAVRRGWDAISRRDLDGFLALMDPEVVAVPRILAVEGGELHGHDGIREWWGEHLRVPSRTSMLRSSGHAK